VRHALEALAAGRHGDPAACESLLVDSHRLAVRDGQERHDVVIEAEEYPEPGAAYLARPGHANAERQEAFEVGSTGERFGVERPHGAADRGSDAGIVRDPKAVERCAKGRS
jgi:hypothetical protein